jgi:hypothetical protein
MLIRTDADIDDGDEGLHPIDEEALTRAVMLMRLEGPGRSAQIDYMLECEPWEQVAEFCACHCQRRNLQLKPWQRPPCLVEDLEGDIARGDDGVVGKFAAAQLLKRMLAAGVSFYEPDPLSKLKAVGK